MWHSSIEMEFIRSRSTLFINDKRKYIIDLYLTFGLCTSEMYCRVKLMLCVFFDSILVLSMLLQIYKYNILNVES